MAAVTSPAASKSPADVELARMNAAVTSAVQRVGSGGVGGRVLLPGSPMHDASPGASHDTEHEGASVPGELDCDENDVGNAVPRATTAAAPRVAPPDFATEDAVADTARARVSVTVAVATAGTGPPNGASGSGRSMLGSNGPQTPALRTLTSETDLVEALTQHAQQSANPQSADAGAARVTNGRDAGPGAGADGLEHKSEDSMLRAEAQDTVPGLRKTPTVPILVTDDRPRKVMSKTLSWKDQHGHHLTHVCYADDLETYGDAVYESPRDEPGCCVIL